MPLGRRDTWRTWTSTGRRNSRAAAPLSAKVPDGTLDGTLASTATAPSTASAARADSTSTRPRRRWSDEAAVLRGLTATLATAEMRTCLLLAHAEPTRSPASAGLFDV